MNNNKQINIAIMSVADIDNYGDTLFPFISQQEILKRIPNANFRFFTPTNFIFEGTQFYGYTKENLLKYNPDAILVIGGEVIHKYDNPVWNNMYKNIKNPVLDGIASNTFFNWLDIKAYKAWFSTGVLRRWSDDLQITNDEINSLDYIGVRGIISKKNLENNDLYTHNNKIDIVPDIGWIFPRYVTSYGEILKKLSEKYSLEISEDSYVVFNTNFSAIKEEFIPHVKNVLSNFVKKTNYKVIIMPIISSYKDYDFLKNFESEDLILLPPNIELKEKVALLCGAKFYIGSSLHSAITTLSMKKPVAFNHTRMLQKFQDLFFHSMNVVSLGYDWNDLENQINRCMNYYSDEKISISNRLAHEKYVDFMQAMFDYKLDLLCSEILTYNSEKNI